MTVDPQSRRIDAWHGYADSLLVTGTLATGLLAIWVELEYWYVAGFGTWVQGFVLVAVATALGGLALRRFFVRRRVGGVWLSGGVRKGALIGSAVVILFVAGRALSTPCFSCLCSAEELETKRSVVLEVDAAIDAEFANVRTKVDEAAKRIDRLKQGAEGVRKVVQALLAMAPDVQDAVLKRYQTDVVKTGEEWLARLDEIDRADVPSESVSKLKAGRDAHRSMDANSNRGVLGIAYYGEPGKNPPVDTLAARFPYCGASRTSKRQVTAAQLEEDTRSVRFALKALADLQEIVSETVRKTKAEIVATPKLKKVPNLSSELCDQLRGFSETLSRLVDTHAAGVAAIEKALEGYEFGVDLKGVGILGRLRGDGFSRFVARLVLRERSKDWLRAVPKKIWATGEVPTLAAYVAKLEAQRLIWWHEVVAKEAKATVAGIREWSEHLGKAVKAIDTDEQLRRGEEWDVSGIQKAASKLVEGLSEHCASQLKNVSFEALDKQRKEVGEAQAKVFAGLLKLTELPIPHSPTKQWQFKKDYDPATLNRLYDALVLQLSAAGTRFEERVLQALMNAIMDPNTKIQTPVDSAMMDYLTELKKVLKGFKDLQNRIQNPFVVVNKTWEKTSSSIDTFWGALVLVIAPPIGIGLAMSTEKKERFTKTWELAINRQDIAAAVAELQKMTPEEREAFLEAMGKRSEETLEKFEDEIGATKEVSVTDFFVLVDVLKSWKQRGERGLSVPNWEDEVKPKLKEVLRMNESMPLKKKLQQLAGLDAQDWILLEGVLEFVH